MIFTDRIITVRKGESKINEPIIIYRGDYELEVKFTIMNSKFKFMSSTNLIESENAAYGQLAILTPYGGNIFSDVTKCNEGAVTFVLTNAMLDQLEEVGLYSFQIRLFDYIKESRVSIPPVEFGIEIREPISSEDHDNSVNNAIVGYSIAKIGDGLNEKVPDTFDADGEYNKTKWETGDRITEGKLDKIEDALDKINQNEKQNTDKLTKQITSNYNVLCNSIDRKADSNKVIFRGDATLDDFNEKTRNLILGLSEGEINAVLGFRNVKGHNIDLEQITLDNTTFGKVGVNKFDGTYKYGYIISGNSTNGMIFTKHADGKGMVAIIPISPNTTYTISKSESTTRFRLATHSRYPQHNEKLDVGYAFNDSLTRQVIYTEDNQNYLIVYVAYEVDDPVPEKMQVEEGDVPTRFTDYGGIYKIEENSISSVAVKKNISIGVQVGYKTAIVVDTVKAKLIIKSDGHYVIAQNTTYSITENKEISFIDSSVSKTMIILLDLNTCSYSLETLAEYRNSKYSDKVFLGVIRHETNGTCSVFVLGNHTLIEQHEDITDAYFSIYGDTGKQYCSSMAYVSHSTNDPQRLYGIYDELCDEFPSYISKSIIGVDVMGNNIYAYDISMSESVPTILLIGNTHGHEKRASFALALFIKDMMTNSVRDEALKTLLCNANFKIIPILNVYGFINNKRKNGNGVDINRNYPTGWSAGGSTDPESDNYKGENPLSEVESNIINNIIEKGNISLIIDCHNSGTYSWLGSIHESQKQILNSVSRCMSFDMSNDSVEESLKRIIVQTPGYGTTVYHANSIGVPGVIIEMAELLKSNATYTQQHSSSLLGNTILAFLRNYR